MRISTYLVLLSLILASSPLIAQRGKIRGKLVDAEGQPQAGVSIHFLARVHPKIPLLPLLDQVEARSENKGRFEAQLLEGIEYGAYALKARAEGAYLWTRVAGGVQAGETRILEFMPKLNGPVRIRVDGREAWKAEEPLRFRIQATPTGMAPWVTQDFDPEGKKAIPRMPAESVRVLVHGKSGAILAHLWIKIGVEALAKRVERQEALSKEERAKEDLLFVGPGLLRLRLKPPVELLVKVTTESKKRGMLQALLGGKKTFVPVPGARIWLHRTSKRVLVGTTDATGMAIVRVPEQWAGSQPILVEADGYAETAENLRRDGVQPGRDLEALKKEGKPDAVLALLPGKRSRTRILLGEGKPAAGMALLLTTAISMGENSWISYGKPYVLWTDDKGNVELPGRVPGMSCRLDLVLDDAARASLGQGAKPGLGPLVTLYQGSRITKELPESIDVSAFARVQLRVQSPPGSERVAPEVLIGRIEGESLDEDSVRSVLADLRGRVTVLMPDKGPWALGACSKFGIKVEQLTLADDLPATTHVIQMDNSLFIEGIVRTSNGSPLVGTRVRCGHPTSKRPELGLLGEVKRYQEILQPRCDDRGHFKLAVPEPDRKYTLRFSVPQGTGGGLMHLSSWNRDVEVGKQSRHGVEITIDPPGR